MKKHFELHAVVAGMTREELEAAFPIEARKIEAMHWLEADVIVDDTVTTEDGHDDLLRRLRKKQKSAKAKTTWCALDNLPTRVYGSLKKQVKGDDSQQ